MFFQEIVSQHDYLWMDDWLRGSLSPSFPFFLELTLRRNTVIQHWSFPQVTELTFTLLPFTFICTLNKSIPVRSLACRVKTHILKYVNTAAFSKACQSELRWLMLTSFFQSVPIRTITLKHVPRRENLSLKYTLSHFQLNTWEHWPAKRVAVYQ